ncbi:CpsD/CapB family tyrosine-protein kinase [Hyphomicrobium nitrativorans]|uniref:CpsD/CapB family tyrosine-protein kinase n=1 Tax=Hyphomicrobium nitrativorans TaxID=1427356 RepID=UPI0011828F9C|nr:CpsD/CapB family tyrosine-protein kinase [Hyphomicrobium nitrativorans]
MMLIDWSQDASGISEALGQPSWPGFSELLEGQLGFEDVVRALADSDVQLIPSGKSVETRGEGLDADSLNFALDALDDVYEHIIVVARTDAGRALFEAIEGRFDNGIMLVDAAAGQAPPPAGSFLGFEVDGISLFTLKMTKETEAPQRRPRAALTRAG